LDNAAYVALIVHLMETRASKGYARPVIVALWTGEEKGAHGSQWFVKYPPVPLKQIAANINLDQLRPIFPLELMTVHARTDTTLGADATAVATAQGIRVQDDPEPERNLLRRSDHWSFLQAGIPAVNFVFGYEPGSRSEEIYRQWYRTGYHRPQDDVAQLMDWQAAADFNRFFYALVDRVANKSEAPSWQDESKLRPGSENSGN
jgi:Zn-dependent M28 family amino/carboxypeptidase